MNLFLLLVIAALSVSSLHMVAPDHWLPLTVISSARTYSDRRKYATAAALGFAHAGTSIAVAMAVFYAGMALIHNYIGDLILAGQVLLVLIGIYFMINGYREKEGESTVTEVSALSVSAFPDFALLPIVVSSAPLSNSQIGIILLLFFLASGISLTAMVFAAEKSLGKAISRVPPKYLDYVIGGVLMLTALLIGLI